MTTIKKYNTDTSQWETIVVGKQGPKGEGVPSAGAVGQVLAKDTSDNYDTSWQTYAKLVNTDSNSGFTIYVGSVDPNGLYTLQLGDVWIQTP